MTRAMRLRGGVSLAVAILLIGGCSDSSSGGDPPTPTPTPTSTLPKAAAYAACMRSNGLAGFPTPDPQGHLQISPQNKIDPNSKEFQAAAKACAALAPSTAKPQPVDPPSPAKT